MKKKVLFIHHSAHIGGAGISGLNALNAMDKEMYDITVYCNSAGNNSDMLQLFRDSGYDVIAGGHSPVIFSHCVGGEKFILSPKFIMNCIYVIRDRQRIDVLIRRVNPDMVIINSMTLFWIGKIAKKHGKETLCFFRETYVKGLFGLRTAYIKRQLSRYMDKIAFIADHERKKSDSVQSHKVTIHNALSEEKYRPYNKEQCIRDLALSSKDYKLLYVGGMSALKGALVAIKAMRYIKDESVKLIFVGYKWNGKKKRLRNCHGVKQKIKYLLGMDYEKKCVDQIVKYKLHSHIIFYNYQPDIAKFFIACDALVFPMTRPHQARPLFEAGFAKIPAIITDFPNIKELADESSCYLFENEDSRDLADAIHRVKQHPELVAKKVECNYIHTMKRHNEEDYAKKINQLLEYGC